MDRHQRAAFRKRIEQALTELSRRQQAYPAEAPLWQPFVVQLKALLVMTDDDRQPELQELERITVGFMAIRELGEEEEDVEEKWRPLYTEMKEIQNGVMNFYEPFPPR